MKKLTKKFVENLKSKRIEDFINRYPLLKEKYKINHIDLEKELKEISDIINSIDVFDESFIKNNFPQLSYELKEVNIFLEKYGINPIKEYKPYKPLKINSDPLMSNFGEIQLPELPELPELPDYDIIYELYKVFNNHLYNSLVNIKE